MNDQLENYDKIPKHDNPHDFIGFENELFKVIAIDTKKETVSLELKGEARIVTVNVNIDLSALRFNLLF